MRIVSSGDFASRAACLSWLINSGLRPTLLTLAILASWPAAATPADGDQPLPAGADSNWLAAVQRNIAAAEYHFSDGARGLSAPNRAHNLRTTFGAKGAQLQDREAQVELLTLQFAGIARGGRSQLSQGGAWRSTENRAERDHGLGVSEWYVNRPGGLEHGFDLAQRLPGNSPLTLNLALSGATIEKPGAANPEQLVLITATGRKLSYGKLKVLDARGQLIPARMQVNGAHQLALIVEDQQAHYPLTVDPLITEMRDTLLEVDQADADFGISVASAGDFNGDGIDDVIVGAPLYEQYAVNEGAAFVFFGRTSGLNRNFSRRYTGGQAHALMGSSVAGAGDINKDGYDDVVVGAPFFDATTREEGGFFVFHGSAAVFSSVNSGSADARVLGMQADIRLGVSVAGAGDVNGDGYMDVIAGAHQYLVEGAAFVFHGSAAGLVGSDIRDAEAILRSNFRGSRMGVGVASAGDVNGDGYADVIVGAPFYSNSHDTEGAAFVFHGSASGIVGRTPGTAAAMLQSNALRAHFGGQVAGAGDINGDGYADVIIGADGYASGQAEEGGAFVFHGSAAGVVGRHPGNAAAILQSNQVGAKLGTGVAAAGDVNGDGYADVIVGAPFYDNGEIDEGAAFLFLGSSTGLLGRNPGNAAAFLESNQAGALFGNRLAGAGDVNRDQFSDVIVGAYKFNNGQAREGVAFVYHGSATGLEGSSPSDASLSLQGDQDNAWLGVSVAAAGDVNGDGYGDVIVGASRYDVGLPDEGAAFLFHGSASGLLGTGPGDAAATLLGNQHGAELGSSVAGAGDVNGDGYDDVIVGVPRYDQLGSGDGIALLFHGSAGGLVGGNPGDAAAVINSDQAEAALGDSVAGAGDINGDGYADVIVGAPNYDTALTNAGVALVFYGSPNGLVGRRPSDAAAVLQCDQIHCVFGDSVSSAGDVNGDGYSDVIVGARGYDSPERNEGAAFVFHGAATGLLGREPADAAAHLQCDKLSCSLGGSVAGAGDVNGDGYGDVIAGGAFFANPESSEGVALVFHGSASGLVGRNPATAAAVIESNQATAYLGTGVAGAGDLNGDGYADVVVGAAFYDNGEVDEGAAFVFHGGASGLVGRNPGEAAVILESNQVNARSGNAVAGAGDVNGDGYADLIVGAAQLDNVGNDEGAAFIFYGNGGGLAMRPQQRRLDNSRPVMVGGMSDALDGFRVALTAIHSYAGCGRLRLQWQVTQVGTPFTNSVPIGESANWINTCSAGPELNELITGLTEDTAYRWRVRLRFDTTQYNQQEYNRWVSIPTGGGSSMIRTAVQLDFGDAPASYPTYRVDAGAVHRISGNSLMLGVARDADADGQPNATATGDDSDTGMNDEDGAVFGALRQGAMASLTVEVTGGLGLLDAWVDFNADGDWADADEQIFDDEMMNIGENMLSFDVPVDAAVGNTFARLRLSSGGVAEVTGFALDGEVEDYQLTIAAAAPAGPDTPDAFMFVDVVDAPLGSKVKTPRLTITGTTVAAPVCVDTGVSDHNSISIDKGPYMPLPDCGSDDSSLPTIAVNGLLSLRHAETSETPSTSEDTRVCVGPSTGRVCDTWTTTTSTVADRVPDPFVVGDRPDSPLNEMVPARGVIPSGFNAPAPFCIDFAMGSDGSSQVSLGKDSYGVPDCAAADATLPTISIGKRLWVRHISANTEASSRTTVLCIGPVGQRVCGTLTSTTRDEDRTPDPFSFSDQPDRALSEEVSPRAVQIKGFRDPAPVCIDTDVSAASSAFLIVGGMFVAPSCDLPDSELPTMESGQQLQVRHTTASEAGTDQRTRVCVGPVGMRVCSTWTTTTREEDRTPDPFSFSDKPNQGLSQEVSPRLVQIRGFSDPAPVCIDFTASDPSSAVRIPGGDFIAPSCASPEGELPTIAPKQRLQLRHTTSSERDTEHRTTVCIGPVATRVCDTWSTTTKP